VSTPIPATPTSIVALAELTSALQRQLASGGAATDALVWTDGDSEVVVYPSQSKVVLQPGLILVEVRLAADQSGTTPVALVIPISVGQSAEDAALIGVTEDVPRGNALLASRWGAVVQNAVWHALVQVGEEKAPVVAGRTTPHVNGLFADAQQVTFLYERTTAVIRPLEPVPLEPRLPPGGIPRPGLR
jgi:hypothetical protein